MLVYLLVSQMIVASAPTPEQSAQILAHLDSPSNFSQRFVCTDCDGPRADIIPSRAGDGPFGAFPQYYFPPLGCCSFNYGGYYGSYFFGGSVWSYPYATAAPYAFRTGGWRSGAVFHTAPGTSSMSGRSLDGFRSRRPASRR